MSQVISTSSSRQVQTADYLPITVLGALCLFFAFEETSPALAIGKTLVFTDVEILMLATVAVWAVTLLRQRRRPGVPQLVWIPGLVWCGALVTSTISAGGSISAPLRFSARMMAGISLAWICYDIVVTSRRPEWIGRCLAIGGGLVALMGLAEVSSLPVIAPWLANFKFAPTRVGDLLRISATLGYATIAAMVLELTFPLLVAWLITTRNRLLQVALIVVGLVYLAILVLTFSRAGVLALGAALAAVVVAAALTHRTRIAVAMGAAIAALAVFTGFSLVYNPDASLRLTSESDQTWYRAAISAAPEVSARPGETLDVPISITNQGEKTWTAEKAHAFALGYHLIGPDNKTITYDGARTALPNHIEPGTTVSVDATLIAPATPMTYRVQWDLVQDGVTWFSWKGSATTNTTLTVSGTPASAMALKYVPPPQPVNTLPVPGRLQLWTAGLLMFEQHPILGVGPDNFRWLYGSYAGLARWNTDIHANNLYIELLADTGILGLAVFMWLAWRIVSEAAGGLWGRSSSRLWIWRVAALASLAAWFVHGLLDYFYEFTPTYVAFWLIVGLALGMAKLDGDERVKSNSDADRI